jgi:PAS domain S-box-containing protein
MNPPLFIHHMAEPQWQLFLEHAPAAIAMFDRELRYLAVSRRWLTDYRVGDQPVLGRSHYEVFPDLPERWKQVHQRCLAGAVERCEEDSFPLADGTTAWMRWEVQPWKASDGTVGGIIIFAEDISSRKQAAIDLQRSRTRLELATSAAQIGVWDWDLSTGELLWDESMYRLYGLRREDFAGAYEAWLTCVHPDDAIRVGDEVQAALRGEKEYAPEFRVIRPADRSVRFIQAGSITLRGADGKPYRMIGTNTDITDRKRAEAELARSKELLERTGEMAKVGGWEMDVATGKLIWTRETARIHGFEPGFDSTLLERGERFYRPDDWKRIESSMQAAIEHGVPFDLEAPFVNDHGDHLWIRAQGFPVVEGGKTTKVRGTIQDLTATVAAREALRASEERYRLIVETAREGIFLFDENWRLAFVNARFAEILGYTKEELIGMPVTQLLFSSDSPGHEARKALHMAGAPSHLENTYRTKSGAPVWAAVSATPIMKDGIFRGSFGMITDITERKKADLALRESEQRLRLQGAALEATINPILITDPAGVIVWVNPAFTRVTGYAFAEAVGQTPRLLKSGQQTAQFYAELWRTILAGRSWSGEVINRRKNGECYNEELTITPVRDPAGVITHFVAVMQDITQRRSLEKQVIETQRIEGIGLLASGIAHDLNNIMAPISLSIGMLRLKYPGEDNLLAVVEQSARRGAEIVRQVLTFARGQGGNRTPLSVGRLVKEMSRLMGETLPRNIEITYDLGTQDDAVHADPTQLHQVLLNLALNARDAMPEGGKLRFTVTKEVLEDGDPNLGLGAKPGEYVVLCVSDTGVGIAPEILTHIFEPFFTTKPRGQGTGLGLSTVHGIVSSHQGFIKVQSTRGAGTTFKVYLPRVWQTVVLAEQSPEAPVIAGAGRTILVADDEPSIQEVVRAVLTQHGFRVLLARDGQSAIDLFRAHRSEIKLVLLDRMMPGTSGETAAASLHEIDPAVPIILATGLMREGDPVEHHAALRATGVVAVLRKPFSAARLLGTIATWLPAAPPDSTPPAARGDPRGG